MPYGKKQLATSNARKYLVDIIQHIPESEFNNHLYMTKRIFWNIINNPKYDTMIYDIMQIEIRTMTDQFDYDEGLNSEERYNPKEFYLRKDQIGDIQYSKYNPMNLSV